jgi:hypothetical protein
VAAVLVSVPLAIFLLLWLHATREFAVLIGCALGLAIFAVVATGTDAHDQAADAAWREAALDLPPVSDRITLERVQASMPGPEKSRRGSGRPRDGHADDAGVAAGQEAETK